MAEELRTRLRLEQAERGLFARVHPAPKSAADVPDDDEAALVILGPEAPHTNKSDASKAREAAKQLLENRSSGARANRNMLVFLAADAEKLGPLNEAIRQFLAWRSIDADKETITLDTFQLRQIDTKRKEADGTVAARLPEAYQWLLVPVQPDPLGPIQFDVTRLTGSGSLAQRAGTKLRSDGGLVTQFGGETLRLELNRHPEIWADGHVELRRLWELFATYVYLPRLRDSSVLTEAVRNGAAALLWRSETFAWAAGRDPATGRYLGLVGGRQTASLPDGAALVIRPDVAAAQLDEVLVETTGGGTTATADTYPTADEHGGETTPKIAERRDPTRFFGSVSVEAGRPGPKFGQLATEVIAHLAALDGADVDVTVEIKANRSSGFPAEVVRTVTENANQLKFDPGAGFEED